SSNAKNKLLLSACASWAKTSFSTAFPKLALVAMYQHLTSCARANQAASSLSSRIDFNIASNRIPSFLLHEPGDRLAPLTRDQPILIIEPAILTPPVPVVFTI